VLLCVWFSVLFVFMVCRYVALVMFLDFDYFLSLCLSSLLFTIAIFYYYFCWLVIFFLFFFFFQAEDGIRDATVTGVQTCALPICPRLLPAFGTPAQRIVWVVDPVTVGVRTGRSFWPRILRRRCTPSTLCMTRPSRSEERRVGKECRSRWRRNDEEKKRLQA